MKLAAHLHLVTTKMVKLYLHSPIRLHSVMFNQVSNFTFTFTRQIRKSSIAYTNIRQHFSQRIQATCCLTVRAVASRPVMRFLVIPNFVSQVPGRQLYPPQPEFRLANISELFRTRVHYKDQPFNDVYRSMPNRYLC